MKSRLTLVLAGVLLTGAIAAGYQGLKLSMSTPDNTNIAEQGKEPVSIAPEPITERVTQRVEQEQRSSVVVLAKDIQPHIPITANELRVEQLLIAPPTALVIRVKLLAKVYGKPYRPV